MAYTGRIQLIKPRIKKLFQDTEGLTKNGRTYCVRHLWHNTISLLTLPQTDSEKLQDAKNQLKLLVEEAGENFLFDKLRPLLKAQDERTESVLRATFQAFGELRREKEETIRNLKEVLSELATPIIRIWTDILLVALIGNIDNQRAQTIAENLLERVSSSRAKVVLVDVTGVSVMDTMVGSFLLEMFNAIRLLGADVILTGIKPNVAHTLVKLGVDFRSVAVARDLEDALRRGISILAKENKRQSYLPVTSNPEPQEGGATGELL